MNSTVGGTTGSAERAGSRSPRGDVPHDAAETLERGRHVVDLALRYAALHVDDGLTQREIGRLRRKSRGYVSILVRFGVILRGFAPEERAVLRHPRITFRVAQQVVRTTTDVATMRSQLRAAVSGFSTLGRENRKGRGRGRRRPRTAADLRSEALTQLPDWVFDEELARRDPMAMLDAYEAHLAALHRAVGTRVRGAIAARVPGMPVSLVGQSLRALTAEVERRGSGAARSGRGGSEGGQDEAGRAGPPSAGGAGMDGGPVAPAPGVGESSGESLDGRRRVLARLAALDRLLRSFTESG